MNIIKIKTSLFLFTIFLFTFCNESKNPQNNFNASNANTVDKSRQVETMRIATNYGIAAHMLFTLGVQDRLVAIDEVSIKNKFFRAIYPSTSEIKTAGKPYDFNVEEGIALKPDILLVPGRNSRLVSRLKNAGLPVYGVIAEDLDQIKNTMIELGRMTGSDEKAKAFVDYYDAKLTLIQERARDLPEKSKPGIFLSGPMGFLSTCSADMYQNHIINTCSGINVSAEMKGDMERHGWVKISAERLIVWDPDIILLVQYGGVKPRDVLTDNRFRNLKAVKNNRVYLFPSELNPWDYPSPQSILGLLWLAKTIYPDLFNDLDIQAEADQFYIKFYRKTFTELGGSI